MSGTENEIRYAEEAVELAEFRRELEEGGFDVDEEDTFLHNILVVTGTNVDARLSQYSTRIDKYPPGPLGQDMEMVEHLREMYGLENPPDRLPEYEPLVV